MLIASIVLVAASWPLLALAWPLAALVGGLAYVVTLFLVRAIRVSDVSEGLAWAQARIRRRRVAV